MLPFNGAVFKSLVFVLVSVVLDAILKWEKIQEHGSERLSHFLCTRPYLEGIKDSEGQRENTQSSLYKQVQINLQTKHGKSNRHFQG